MTTPHGAQYDAAEAAHQAWHDALVAGRDILDPDEYEAYIAPHRQAYEQEIQAANQQSG